MSYQILRTRKLTDWGAIVSSGSHNYRERPTPNADAGLRVLNTNEGARSVRELRAGIEARIEGLELRHDTVKCIEYLITASPAFFANEKGEKDGGDAYFKKAKKWLEEKHGAENIVALSIHRDEKTPHMVAYVTPVITKAAHSRKRNVADGFDDEGNRKRKTITVEVPEQKMLSAKHFLGGREKLSLMQTDFHQKVSRRFDLERGEQGSKATHKKVKTHYAQMDSIIQRQHKTADDVASISLELMVRREQLQAEKIKQAKEREKLEEEKKQFADEKLKIKAVRGALDLVEKERFDQIASEIYKQAKEAAAAERAGKGGSGIRMRPIKPT